MSTKKEQKETKTAVEANEIVEEHSEEDDFPDYSEEEDYEPVTLEYTIPGTNEFVRLDLLDADEERAAFDDMYETCGEDFTDFQVL